MMFNKRSILLVLLTGALFDYPVFAQEKMPDPQQTLHDFGIGADKVAELERGGIIDYEVSETSQQELAIGVAMILPVALPKIIDYIKQGNLTGTESGIIASAPLANNADINSFKKFAFTDNQLDEAKAFVKAEPGDKFNLSKPEIDSLKSLQTSLKGADNKTLLKAANQKYREILLQRWLAYRKSGLSGIAPYSRENGTTDPATELRNDAVNSKAWARYFPDLQQAWLNYPAALPPNATEQFLWLNRNVEDRPTAILLHRIMVTGETGGIIVSRQFYVGHSYSCSNAVAGGVPYKDGTLVFYSIRSSTDQVAGIGSSLKHSIGREQMKEEMIKRLQRLNKDLKR
ncbi:hypothetical protein [Methylobacter sp.]|uniref:hypothetical protein n=1 Tax=Methylobacter sp. TaxID=2051955 RepID=UPI002FDCDC7C